MATREETETVITWTSADEEATVYTMHERIRKRCARVGKEISPDQGVRNGKKVAWRYLVPIGCISIRPRRRASQAVKDALISARTGVKREEVASS